MSDEKKEVEFHSDRVDGWQNAMNNMDPEKRKKYFKIAVGILVGIIVIRLVWNVALLCGVGETAPETVTRKDSINDAYNKIFNEFELKDKNKPNDRQDKIIDEIFRKDSMELEKLKK